MRRITAILAILLLVASNSFAARELSKASHFGAFVQTTDGTATRVAEIKTEPGTVYLVDFSIVAREQAGADQGKAYGIKCHCVGQNVSGTAETFSTDCEESHSGLTPGNDPVCDADGVTFFVTVQGNADTVILWVGDFTVHANAAKNVVVPTTTTTSSTSTTTTSTSSTTSTTLSCIGLGEVCASSGDCCSLHCEAFICSCLIGLPCSQNIECCSNICNSGTCNP
jgi:hypothetical protein